MCEPGVQSRSRPPDGAASSRVRTPSACTSFAVTRSVATSADTGAGAGRSLSCRKGGPVGCDAGKHLSMDERPAPHCGMARTATGESSLARAVRVLEAFTPDEPELSVSEIARRSGLHVATASRIVGQLADHGLLEPGARPRGAHRDADVGAGLPRVADPVAPRRGDALPRGPARRRRPPRPAGGPRRRRRPLPRAAVGPGRGRQLLADRRPAAAAHLLVRASCSGLRPAGAARAGARAGRWSATPRRRSPRPTGSAPPLEQVRRQGYALLAGHVHQDATGIAVPVRDGLGEVVAALSVIVPNDDRAVSAVPALLAAAPGSQPVPPERRRRRSPPGADR